MLKALLVAPKKIELRKSEIPKLDCTHVLVRVRMCGVCTTEIPVYLGKTQGNPGASFRYHQYPSMLGHETSGVVEDIGGSIRHFKPGDEVTGVAYSGSGFGEFVIEDERYWVKIPDGFKLEETLGEPLMCAVNIVRMAEISPADKVLVIGDGFMGLLATSLLVRYLLDSLIIVGHHQDRLTKAKRMGADYICAKPSLPPYRGLRGYLGECEGIRGERLKGGFDIAFDFTGTMAGLQLGASLLKPKQRAKLMMAGVYKEEPFTLGEYMVNRGVFPIACHPAQSPDIMDDLRRAMVLLGKGVFPMSELITHEFSLDQIGEAFEMSIERRDGYIKGIVIP